MSKKITFVFISFVFLFLLVLGKAFYIQVINRSKLINYSKSQVIKKETIHPQRAAIFDRNGAPLAINVPAYDLFMMPQTTQMTADGIKKLVKIIPSLNYEKLRKDVITRKRFTWVARKQRLTSEEVKKLKKIRGLNIDETVKRYYPNGNLLSQTIGFVGIDNKGLAGIEYKLDNRLRGKKKEITYYKDAKGRPIKHISREFAEKSDDIYLSIEKDVQIILEEALKEGVEKHQADLGGAVVLDAETGELIAVANYPTYNPNRVRGSNIKDRKLSFVTNPFEPGSILKIVTVASALEHQIVQPESVYYCEKGNYKIGKHIIREADTNKKHEWLSVSNIIKYSSNIGTTKIAFDLGFDKLRKTFEKFKIGEKTGIELPAESKGIFIKSKRTSKIKLSNVSFGQGIATTALQMLAAYGVIVNDGYYVKPTILKRNSLVKGVKVLNIKTVDKLKKMLIKAVHEGTGKKAQIKNFDIGGKTSTAQRASEQGGYEGYVSGFIGASFNNDRKYVVYVYVDNPQKNGYYGSTVAAPIFKKIMEYLLLKKAGSDIDNSIKKNEKLESFLRKAKEKKRTVFSKNKMPDLIGLDRKSVEKILEDKGLEFDLIGVGLAKEQTPKKGSKIGSQDKVKVIFSVPSYD